MQKTHLSDALTDSMLNQAWSKVYENQGCAGVDQQTLDAFAGQLNLNLETLRNEVCYGTYHHCRCCGFRWKSRTEVNAFYPFQPCATGCCKRR